MRRLLSVLILAAGCGGPDAGIDSLAWLAMGTTAQISFKSADGPCTAGEGRVLGDVKDVFENVECKMSIWKADSEISRYRSIDSVSRDMRPCYEAAFALREKSGGAFDPFWRGPGNGPDLGAIAKGFAVDLAAERISRGGMLRRDLLIDLGGNLKAVSGTWRVGIRDPSKSGGIAQTLVLSNGMACATSGEYERGKHIKDGRTGLAVTNDLLSVTVVHPSSAMMADALSTTLFILGSEKGTEFLKKWHPEAKVVWIRR